ncbi:MAG: Asp-tRNA(Asn)/Glu-tRNA(Gln) amidotransferase subunit GatC [Myxococcota bacterium]|jgi:aspartyl-tRNA(Asn)/glutamyl-tRNA(Gln) amidotransferase subunit C|nr:Asp-tRNA(Asn)/Glu-tRNA(Gln) amidotransferase subunit GatC [Myxococcota bacterium]
MSDPIDEATVRHVAKLARLRLSDAEVAGARADLASVLAHVDELAVVDVEGVSPSFHVGAATGSRDDVLVPGLPREVVLAGAPEPRDDGFAVPQVIE